MESRKILLHLLVVTNWLSLLCRVISRHLLQVKGIVRLGKKKGKVIHVYGPSLSVLLLPACSTADRQKKGSEIAVAEPKGLRMHG